MLMELACALWIILALGKGDEHTKALDGRRIVEDHEAGCAAGDMRRCVKAGWWYYTGIGGVQQDPARARKLFDEACRHSEPRGCYDLGVMYRRGVGSPVDSAKAVEEFAVSCRMGYQAGCTAWRVLVLQLAPAASVPGHR